MGIGLHIKKDGTKTYWIEYYVEGRRRKEFIGPNRKVAGAVLNKRKTEIAEGRFLDKKRESRVSFKEFAEEYLKVHGSKKKVVRSLSSRIAVLCREFGSYRLSEITPLMIEKYQAKKLEAARPATVNRELAALKNMCAKAIQWGYTSENLASKVKMLKEENQRTRYLPLEEKARLLAASPGHLKAILVTAFNTGMRKSEILGLTWEQVDFPTGHIHLTKTKSSSPRAIPMTPELTATLRNLRMNRFKGDLVFHRGKEGQAVREDGSSFDCRKAFETTVKKTQEAVCLECKKRERGKWQACHKGAERKKEPPTCEHTKAFEDFRFHDTRHTFASHFLMSGGDVLALLEILGHKSSAMTRRYSHLSQDDKRKAMDNFGRYLQGDGDMGGDMTASAAAKSLRARSSAG